MRVTGLVRLATRDGVARTELFAGPALWGLYPRSRMRVACVNYFI